MRLTKLIDGNNKNIQIGKNDLIIFSSREIPGNEIKINTLKEKILKKIANILIIECKRFMYPDIHQSRN